MKKVLSMALALVLLLGMLPMTAQALDTVPCFDVSATAHAHVASRCTLTTEHANYPTGTEAHVDSNNNGICDLCDYHTHTGGTATCKDKAVCTICGEAYGELRSTHTGGTANCQDLAVCTDCGASYGAKDANNHKAVADYSSDAAGHWKNCTACSQMVAGTNGTHTYTPGAYVDVTATSHSQVCNVCGYKTTIAHNFVDEGCTQQRCICGQTSTGTVDNHAWVEATCTAPRTCNTCGAVDNTHPALDHDWADATCTAPKTCKRATCRVTQGSALGHSWNGTTCRICGTTKEAVPQYHVYYNLNVNGTARTAINKTYDIYTPMSTVLADLSLMNITYPGRYPTWYSLEGWYTDANCTNRVNANAQLTSDITLYAKWNQNYHYEVVLKLYTNGNTNNVVKVVDAFYYVQNDGILSRDEIQDIAKHYFEPVSNAGLIVYGPYDSNNWSQYTLYPNRMGGQEQYIVQDNGTIVLYAMIHNVAGAVGTTTAKKADSTNPKTGDMIMMPAAVLGLSASALAVMFYLNKKKRVM